MAAAASGRSSASNERVEKARMYLLTVGIKAAVVRERRSNAMLELRRRGDAALLRLSNSSRRISVALVGAARRREEARGQALLAAMMLKFEAATRISTAARGAVARLRVESARADLEARLAARLLGLWHEQRALLRDRAATWIFLRSQSPLSRAARARALVLDLESGRLFAGSPSHLVAAERTLVYRRLKAGVLDLDPVYESFGLARAKRRKRRLIAKLFATTDLASASAALIDAVLHDDDDATALAGYAGAAAAGRSSSLSSLSSAPEPRDSSFVYHAGALRRSGAPGKSPRNSGALAAPLGRPGGSASLAFSLRVRVG